MADPEKTTLSLTSAFQETHPGRESEKARHEEAAVLLYVSKQRPIVAIRDTDHRTGDSLCFLNNPELIQGWERQGKKDIYLEMNEKYAPQLDDFYKGKMSKSEFEDFLVKNVRGWQPPEKYKETLHELVEGIDLAKKNGIQVHFINRTPEILSENPKNNEIFWNVARMKGEERPLKEINEYIEKEMPGGIEGYKSMIATLKEQREAVDPYVADRIHQTMQGKGAVVVFGSWHFSKLRDLDERLGSGLTVSVSQYKNEQARQEDQKEQGWFEDSPHYIYTRTPVTLDTTSYGDSFGMTALSLQAKAPSVRPEELGFGFYN